MGEIVLFLGFPVTVNSYYTSGSGKQKFISKAGRSFRDDVIRAVSEQLPNISIDYRMHVQVILFMPDSRVRDLDNYMKALLDAITHSGLWEDDNLIDQLEIFRGETVKKGCVKIVINEAGPIVPFQT